MVNTSESYESLGIAVSTWALAKVRGSLQMRISDALLMSQVSLLQSDGQVDETDGTLVKDLYKELRQGVCSK